MVFFFNDTATTEIYTLSLHDALPILPEDRHHGASASGSDDGRCPTGAGRVSRPASGARRRRAPRRAVVRHRPPTVPASTRSEEHTSELQSRQYLVCRLLLEKKQKTHPHKAQARLTTIVIHLRPRSRPQTSNSARRDINLKIAYCSLAQIQRVDVERAVRIRP